jgi:hypothetical protein
MFPPSDGFAQKPVSFPARFPGPTLIREQTADLQSTTQGSAYFQISCFSSKPAARIPAKVESTQCYGIPATGMPLHSMTLAHEFGEIGGDMVVGQY